MLIIYRYVSTIVQFELQLSNVSIFAAISILVNFRLLSIDQLVR